jgi:hypothetical protein
MLTELKTEFSKIKGKDQGVNPGKSFESKQN